MPITRRVQMTRLRRTLLDQVNRARYANEHIGVTYHGQPVIVILSYRDYEKIQEELAILRSLQEHYELTQERRAIEMQMPPGAIDIDLGGPSDAQGTTEDVGEADDL